MFFVWLRHRAAWLVLAALAQSPAAFAQETVDWTEDALLRDGRSLVVRLQGNSLQPSFYLAQDRKSTRLNSSH